MRIGITGATGFLGSRMTSILQEKGVDVRCLVRKTSISKLKGLDVEIIVGDLQDETALEKFVLGLDVCFHLAALVGFASKA